jgi:curli biogenesis system outer membrane secretion channel CsgG
MSNLRYLGLPRHFMAAALCAALGLMAGCGGGKNDKPQAAASAPADGSASAAPPLPDMGKLETETSKAEGFGASAGEAVAEAMKLAILQVNGAVMQSSTVTAKYGLDVSLGKDSASLRASEFAEIVKQRSGGVIQNFKVLELQEPTTAGALSSVTGSPATPRYKATIEAQIAKFKPSADMQKVKVVIGPVRFTSATLPMGDKSIASDEIAATLRQRISDALVQTGRFAVLDREMSPEIENELTMISSGQAPSAELAKLSQAASADIVWSARVSNLAYNRHARQLRTTNRELVSYSGGWAITQKLVNVATRQVMASESLEGQAPSTEPTTLGSGVDGAKVLQEMSNEIVNQVVASILRRTFPIVVVGRDGTNVILSQGGQAMQQGARYEVVTMGNEMKDPQTGQSLGRTEARCCELVVDRVTPSLSYGHLEGVRSGTNLDNMPIAGLQVRSALKASALVTAAAPAAAAPAEAGPEAPAAGQPGPAAPAARGEKPAARHATKVGEDQNGPAGRNDDKW